MNTKKTWQSKTIWANVIAILITLTGLMTPETLLLIGIDNTTKFIGIMTLIVAAINIVLRHGEPVPIDNSVPKGTDYSTTEAGKEAAKNTRQ